MSININIFKALDTCSQEYSIVRSRSVVSREPRERQRERKLLAMVDLFVILIVVIFSWIFYIYLYIYNVKNYQTVYFKYMQFVDYMSIKPFFKIWGVHGWTEPQSTFQKGRINLHSTSTICECLPHYTFVSTDS